MGYKNKSLKKVPHELTYEMKNQRVSCSIELLKILSRLRKNQFRYFTTGDQSFFFYFTHKEKIWLPSDIDPPERSTAKFEYTKSHGYYFLVTSRHSINQSSQSW